MDGMEVRGWALMDLARLTDQEYQQIVRDFERIGNEVKKKIHVISISFYNEDDFFI